MLNSFLGIGRLGHDAELSTAKNGRPMARFSIAIQKNGPKKEELQPDWIRCFVFGERATKLAPYLTRGLLISVSGRLETYKSPEDGRKILGIDVDEVNFLKRPAAQGSKPAEEMQEALHASQ